jgi:hypothetical protein
MGAIIYLVVVVGTGFFLASFTGGMAGAIAAGGREDRSLIQNAGIGFVAWVTTCLIVSAPTGRWPDQMSVGIWLGTLAVAIVIAWLLDRRRKPAPSKVPAAD